MDRSAYLNRLVNAPWTKEGLHCWEFVRLVRRDLFGDEGLPGMEWIDRRQRMETFERHPERARWERVASPQDGDVALMSKRTATTARDSHAGIYLVVGGRGLVWHSDHPQGVVADSLAELTELRRWHPTFYRRRDDLHSSQERPGRSDQA